MCSILLAYLQKSMGICCVMLQCRGSDEIPSMTFGTMNPRQLLSNAIYAFEPSIQRQVAIQRKIAYSDFAAQQC